MNAKIRSEGRRLGLMLLVLIPASVSALTGTAKAAVITLWEEAFVSGMTIRLGDLAEIESQHTEVLAEIELGPAATPGASRQLSAAVIEARIRNAGLSLDSLELKGARAVRATTLHREVSKEQIAESLREYIWMEMPWDHNDTEVDVPTPLSAVTVPEGELVIEWRANPQYRYVGAGAFRGTIKVDGEVQKTMVLRATIETYTDVVVAANDIQRGKILGPGDVELVKQAMSRLPSGAVLNVGEVGGMISRRTLFAGQVLTTQHIEAPRVVQRNQVVPVEMQAGTLRVQSRARALSDGRAGDLILVANLNSKEQYQGLVRADGVVVVE